MRDAVAGLEVFTVSLRQDTPYLGALRPGEEVNDRGYFVRRGNRTMYPRENRSLVVRAWTESGREGWGETYGLVAPLATAEIINDALAPFVVGREPYEVEAVHDDLYDLMRVRGYTGGFYLDALAAIDIALWDLLGKLTSLPICRLLGGQRRDHIPAYISGLPERTLDDRCQLAARWQSRGFADFKFALPVADRGAAEEIRRLRERLGPEARIACDMHWSQGAVEAVQSIDVMAPYVPWFVEAPVATENIDGLRLVAERSTCPIAVGEEWRTVFDARLRIDRGACHIVQPEMGHTGVTQFMRIARYAAAHHLPVMPHATIGAGIFLAASLQASAALPNLASHEYQHSLLDPFRHFTGDRLQCENGAYKVPNRPGIGVEPSEEMKRHMRRVPTGEYRELDE